MRTFVALDLDAEIKAGLADFIRRLKKLSSSAHVSWARDSGMHITFKFLGDIPESKIAEVAAAMKTAASSVAGFPVRVRGTGFFPPQARSPRVLWVALAPEPLLGVLQTSLEAELEKLGFERETRPFHPHVTLGRVKSAEGLKDIMAELELNQNTDFGGMTVRHLTLFQSVLSPGGAVYSILEEGRLA